MSANNGTSDTTEAKRSKRLPGWFRFRPSRGHISRAALMRLTDLAIAAFNAEGDNGRLWLWFPVFFLIGIAVFFHLPADPISPAFAFATLGIAVLALGMNRSGKSAIIPAAVATFLAGMAVADWQTDRVLAPRLDRERTAQVTGEVLHVEPARSGRLRLTISPETIDGVDFAQMPERIRVSIRSGSRKPSAGERISFLARLTPPSGPVLVGGYDFSFHAFFEGRGAGGFVLGGYTMAPEQAARDTGWLRAFKQGVDRLRNWLDDRIDSALQGSEAAVAKALITGHRGAIPTAVSEDLRRAGLAHILAISGLHMALLTASVFWLVRSFLALSPSLALDFPIKKWACLAAFAAASAYLLLSGAKCCHPARLHHGGQSHLWRC